jgi:hypothetical protein
MLCHLAVWKQLFIKEGCGVMDYLVIACHEAITFDPLTKPDIGHKGSLRGQFVLPHGRWIEDIGTTA